MEFRRLIQQMKIGNDTLSQHSLLLVDFSLVLKDLSSPNKELVDSSLNFLGGLAQLVKMPIDKQQQVIKALAEKAKTVRSEKTQSRKVPTV